MQPSTAQKPQPSEDIDTVLSRFQAWSGSRKTNEFKDGVRELSYEEALQSSRYRWQAHIQSPRERASQPKTEQPQKEKLGPEPGVVPVASPVIAPPPRPASASFHVSPAREAPDRDEDPLADDTVNFSATTPDNPAAAVARTKTASAHPEFRAVLAKEVLPAPHPTALARKQEPAAQPERQVSMTLRVAASEQALIKVRAEEAGLSASAYLRQCALEVEQLRAQMQFALGVIERNSLLALPEAKLPIQPPPVGFLSRMRQRLFGSGTALALRA